MLRGQVGRILWAYYPAAAIEGYSVTRTPGQTWKLKARVVLADRFKLAQRPLVFEAPYAHGVWRWPIEELTLADDVLTARLGPLEETCHGLSIPTPAR